MRGGPVQGRPSGYFVEASGTVSVMLYFARSVLNVRAFANAAFASATAFGEEGEKSQSMLVAQMLISTAFLLFLGFPAVSQLLKA